MNRAAASKSARSGADRRKLILYVTIAIVVIAAVIGVALGSRVPKAASDVAMNAKLKVGDTAPQFAVSTNAGPFDLAGVSAPVLLEVFATWCPHCQRETVVLNQLAAQYAGKVAIVAVSGSPYGFDGSTPESQADVMTFGQRFNVRYPIAFDGELKVGQQYLQGGFPTLVLIDKNKKIAWIKDGEIPEADIVKAVNAVL